MTKHCTKPCANCPFSRKSEPGYLGGGNPLSFVGQAHGPFVLPCHMQEGYDPKTTDLSSVQCGGAAIFRANVGADRRMPAAILPHPGLNVTVNGGKTETDSLVACATPPLAMLMDVAAKLGALPPQPPADYHCGDPDCDACNANAEANKASGAAVH